MAVSHDVATSPHANAAPTADGTPAPAQPAAPLTRRFGRRLLRDIGAPMEGTIVSAAVISVVGSHAHQFGGVVMAWAVVLCVYWLTHVYLHALKDQLNAAANPLHRRLATHMGHQIGVLAGGVPVILAFVIPRLLGADQSLAVYLCLGWTVFQLGAGVLAASWAARLPLRRALPEALLASAIGALLVVAKVFLH